MMIMTTSEDDGDDDECGVVVPATRNQELAEVEPFTPSVMIVLKVHRSTPSRLDVIGKVTRPIGGK